MEPTFSYILPTLQILQIHCCFCKMSLNVNLTPASCPKIRRLSSDSPDALYELLCALQEGRRLNDQRCSFTLQPRRRCHSEPGTPRLIQKGEEIQSARHLFHNSSLIAISTLRSTLLVLKPS